MKVIISRTSQWTDSGPPYKGSQKFTYNTPQVLDREPHMFYQIGENHRIMEDGKFYRELVSHVWTVEIESIEEFIRQNGSCVVSFNQQAQMFDIEIYDSWRE